MKKALGKLKILFLLFRSLNLGTPVSQDDNGILEVFGPENTLIQGFLLELMSWSSVCDPGLIICLFLRIPGVTFASKVDICKLVIFCILLYLVSKMSTEHHILKAILSRSILFVKPSGNVLSWVKFLSWDSVVGMTKIMVKEGKGQWKHVSPVSSTMKIVSKHLFCPMNNHKQRFLQKTTWATIMSQDDKTCIIACLLLNMH